MAALHNIMLRAFNSSYNQCLGVSPGTGVAGDFLQYNQVLCEHIKGHHDHEEEVFFPALQDYTGQKGIMDQNIQEHQELEEGLQKLQDYAFNTDAHAYDGEKLRSILDILGRPSEKHFHGEMSTLISLAEYDSETLEKIWDETSSKAAAAANKFRSAVQMIGCGDNSFLLDGKRINFPDYPFFVPHLAKYILARPFSATWRFNPSDFFGNPRDLEFPNPTLSEG